MGTANGPSAMRGRNSITTRLKYGASILALGALVIGAPAMAQTAAQDDKTVDEVVVTSIKQSLKSSQQLKQSSEIIGDSITAEDIGALPDRSVTEALQRVPGVAINRFAAGVDPDHFSVEGSGVVVRGLNFVRSELNGRDTFSANNGRALSFADVPAELMGGVDVFKSPSADLIEGGISGTVNLRTRLPFDSKKRILSLSLENSYGDFVKKWAPSFTLLASDTFETNIGEIGVLASYTNSKLWTRSDGTQASNFSCRTNLGSGSATCPNGQKGVWFPRGAAFRSTTTEREREGQAAAVQWRSNDRTMQATVQYLRSDSKQAWTEHAMEIATDNVTSNGDSRAVAGTSFTFDDEGIFTNGVITGSQGWRSDQNSGQPRTPANGLQSNNIRRDVDQTYITSDIGANFKWTPNDNWGFQADYQHISSKVKVLDVGLWGSTFQNLQMQMNGNDAPVFTFLPPSNDGKVANCLATPSGACQTYFNGTHTSFSDPYNSFWRSAMDHVEQSDGKEDAVRFDAEYKFDDNTWLDSVKAGVRWSERDQTTRFSTYNWGVVSEIWGEGGPVWFDDKVDGIPTPGSTGLPGTLGADSSSRTELYTFQNFFRGQVPTPTGSEGRLFYNQNIVQNYAAFAEFVKGVGSEWRPTYSNGCQQNWVPLAQRCGTVAGTPFLPGEINPVTETTKSIYAMARFKHDFEGDIRLTGNVGLRYSKVNRESEGLLVFQRVALTTDQSCRDSASAGQTVSRYCQQTLAIRNAAQAFLNGATTPNTAKISYDYFLPSLNLKLALPNKVQLRFAASKAVAPPDVGFVRNYYNVNLDVSDATLAADPTLRGIITVGNPYLKPTKATNFDFSAEWYFAPVGSLTFAVFEKQLKGVLTNATVTVPYTNNGSTFDVKVTTPMNSSDTAHVRGFEIGYQQFYTFLPKPFDGFGINANYSYIDSKGVPQSTLSNTDPDVGAGRISNVNTGLLPLQGLSKHNLNVAAIYENKKISARLAYNWRSDFLLTVRDVIVPYAPIMNEATGQLDGSVFYTVNNNVKIGVQGVNLLNEITRTSQVLNNDLLKTGRSWFMNDRRYTLVLRASF